MVKKRSTPDWLVRELMSSSGREISMQRKYSSSLHSGERLYVLVVTSCKDETDYSPKNVRNKEWQEATYNPPTLKAKKEKQKIWKTLWAVSLHGE